jgi:glycosyltransferase involved in cell wall biosynthesis
VPSARLVVLGWGTDQSSAHNQLAAHGLLGKVLFLPIVGKARLARYLRAADVLIEQFVLGYYGASALEAIASGLPVIMRLERAQYDALVPNGAPPVLDANDAATVEARLHRLYGDPDYRRDVGAATRRWFIATHSGGACWRDYKLLLDAATLGVEIDWSKSPLAAEVSNSEKEYFADRLANAPKFPEYSI